MASKMAAPRGNAQTRNRRGEFRDLVNDPSNHLEKDDKDIAHRIPFDGRYVWPVILCFYFLIFAFIQHRIYVFPAPKTQLPGFANDTFYESNARVHLNQLTSHGPRVVGSEANEKFAFNYILEQLSVIQSNSLATRNIEVDVQNVTGSFDIAFLTDYVSVYRNIKNIAVRLSTPSTSTHSLLMSCHFDSSIDSPGAGDNAISCGVMLEVLRVFSQSEDPLQHNIIFLFNGAEENLLQASHGFITQHPWAKDIKAFVNIDSAGAGGWEIVFQTGPSHPWLVRAYAEATPHPSGSIFGQEVFQSGLIPSDTDFRIYRDFGEIPGLDIAYITNGYVYHTQNDQTRFIQPGCIQRGGENLLALLRKLASSPKLADPGLEKEGMMIFFDVVGYVMVYYPERVAVIVNSALIAAILFRVIRKSFNIDGSGNHDVKYLQNITSAIMYITLTWLVIGVTSVTMAIVMTMLGRNMSWFTHTYNVLPIFIFPSLIAVFLLHEVLKEKVLKSKSAWYNEQIFFEANMTLWSILLLYLTVQGVGSAFFPMLYVLGPLFIRDRTMWVLKSSNWKEKPYSFLTLHLSSILLPNLLTMYMGYASIQLFIPIMGRLGTAVNTDIAIGIMFAMMFILLSGYLVSICYISSNMKQLMMMMTGLTVAWLLAICLTPLGFPYSSSNGDTPTPMRLLAVHSRRRAHNIQGEMTYEDGGILILPFDYNNNQQLIAAMPSIQNVPTINSCELGPYCGQPYLIPVMTMLHPKKNQYIPTAVHQHPSISMKLVSVQRDKLTAMFFEVTGPDHMTMQVRPHPDVTLKRWSLSTLVPEPADMPPDLAETTYFVYYSHGETPAQPWTFSMHFQVPKGHDISKGIVDIGIAGHYLHGVNKTTVELQDFLDKTPHWSTPVTWTASWDGFVF